MAAKPGSRKKSGITRRKVDAEDKDRQVAELNHRIAVLENELQLKRDAINKFELYDELNAMVKGFNGQSNGGDSCCNGPVLDDFMQGGGRWAP